MTKKNQSLMRRPSGYRATSTAIAAADKTWDACKMSFHRELALKAFSGTTTVSPGRSAALATPPPNNPLLPPTTEPSARITKMPFLYAVLLGPPAWPRYHPADLPGL